jgi:hypothetical protein
VIDGHSRIVPQRGELAAAALSATTAGTAHAVLTTTKDSVLVSIENTTDAELMVTRDGVDFKRMPAGSFRVFDVKADGVAFGPYVWGVYEIGNPTSGFIEIVALPHR